jgi:hypothetical protein
MHILVVATLLSCSGEDEGATTPDAGTIPSDAEPPTDGGGGADGGVELHGYYEIANEDLVTATNLGVQVAFNPFWAQDAPGSLAFLDACESAGIVGAVGFVLANATDQTWVTTYVNAIADHSALYAYVLPDESLEAGNATLGQLEALTEWVRAADPDHPIIYTGFNRSALAQIAATVDVVNVDVYPFRSDGDAMTVEQYDQWLQAARSDWPNTRLIVTFQAFGPQDPWVEPTLEEMTGQIHAARAAGAEALIGYTWLAAHLRSRAAQAWQ